MFYKKTNYGKLWQKKLPFPLNNFEILPSNIFIGAFGNYGGLLTLLMANKNNLFFWKIKGFSCFAKKKNELCLFFWISKKINIFVLSNNEEGFD